MDDDRVENFPKLHFFRREARRSAISFFYFPVYPFKKALAHLLRCRKHPTIRVGSQSTEGRLRSTIYREHSTETKWIPASRTLTAGRPAQASHAIQTHATGTTGNYCSYHPWFQEEALLYKNALQACAPMTTATRTRYKHGRSQLRLWGERLNRQPPVGFIRQERGSNSTGNHGWETRPGPFLVNRSHYRRDHAPSSLRSLHVERSHSSALAVYIMRTGRWWSAGGPKAGSERESGGSLQLHYSCT